MAMSPKVVLLATLIAFGGHVQAQDSVTIGGTTTALIDRDSVGQPLSEVKYFPIEGVEVVACRSTPVARFNSRTDGTFDLTVVRGRPFTVVFRDPANEDIVPELQQLSGKDGTDHCVHVTLLTVIQYEEIYGRETLLARLEYIQRVLARVDGEDVDATRDFIERLLKRLTDKID